MVFPIRFHVRPVKASAQTDQSLCWSPEDTLDPWLLCEDSNAQAGPRWAIL